MEEQNSPPLSGYLARHQAMAAKHFTDAIDDQTMVLKAHLLLEQVFRDFCSRSVPNPEHLQGSRLTFKQIALLSRSLASNESKMAALWPAVNHLNSLRNTLAHELEPSDQNITRLQQSIIAAVEAQRGNSGKLHIIEALGYICGCFSAYLHYPLDRYSSIEEQAGSVE